MLPYILVAQSSIMSFNLRYDNPNDNENSWDERKKEIVQMIRYYSPEILGIQEGLNNQVNYLDTALNEYNYVGVGRDDGKVKGEYSAIFYKTGRIKLLSTKTYWLSQTPDTISVGWDASMERIATYGEFVDIQTRDTLYIFNCHFDHIGKIAQKNSAKLLLKILNEKKLTEKKVIIMGDLNCEPNDLPIEIFKTQMDDPYNEPKVTIYGPLGTFNQFNAKLPITKRIDYILTKNIKVTEYTHIDDRRKNNLLLSDHMPIHIKIK